MDVGRPRSLSLCPSIVIRKAILKTVGNPDVQSRPSILGIEIRENVDAAHVIPCGVRWVDVEPTNLETAKLANGHVHRPVLRW
jgi:hypothetical protein